MEKIELYCPECKKYTEHILKENIWEDILFWATHGFSGMFHKYIYECTICGNILEEED